MIVANKFQTGFDQPLLHTMYVDKALGGVATVQTLSRLNRITNGKKDTLVIDFANKEVDIKKDFQDYYQTTTLEDAIDTQKIYNLKYEIEKVDVFSREDVTQFIEKSIRKQVKSEILSSDFRKIIDENYVPLDPEDKKQFRDNLNKYIRQYAFISQIITFIDTDLEKFYLFVKLLYKYLPYEKATLPLEIIQMVNMDKYRLEEIDEKKDKFSIKLNTEDATITNNQSDGHKPPTPEPTAVLETIIKEINEKYSVDLGDDDKVVKEVYKTLKEDEGLISSLRANNIEDVKKMKLRESIEDALLKNAELPIVFLNKLTKDKGFANHVVSKFFNLLMDELKDDAA